MRGVLAVDAPRPAPVMTKRRIGRVTGNASTRTPASACAPVAGNWSKPGMPATGPCACPSFRPKEVRRECSPQTVQPGMHAVEVQLQAVSQLAQGREGRAGGDGVADDGALFRRAARITGLDERLVDALARSCVSDETARDARFDERYEEAAHRMIAGIGGRIPRITKGRVPRRTSA